MLFHSLFMDSVGCRRNIVSSEYKILKSENKKKNFWEIVEIIMERNYGRKLW